MKNRIILAASLFALVCACQPKAPAQPTNDQEYDKRGREMKSCGRCETDKAKAPQSPVAPQQPTVSSPEIKVEKPQAVAVPEVKVEKTQQTASAPEVKVEK